MALAERKEEHVPGFGLYFEGEILAETQSEFQHITIGKTEGMGRYMLLDGLVMVTERDEQYYHESIVHPVARYVPQLSHALVIGGGDGGTARELLRYGCKVTLVEIDAEVMHLSRLHLPTMGEALGHPDITVHVADGCEFVREADADLFDMIVIDSSEPIGPNGTLFTPEFYTDIRRVLKSEGYCVIQAGSPMYQQDTIDDIAAKVGKIFTHTQTSLGITPTYPGGHWTFLVCGDQPLATQPFRGVAAGARWCTDKVADGLLAIGDLRLDSPGT